MAALPAYDTSDLVTKSDLALFGAELRAEFKTDLAAVNTRIDRLFLAMMSGFVVTLGTTVGFFLAPAELDQAEFLDRFPLLGELCHRRVDPLPGVVIDLETLDDLPSALATDAGERRHQTLGHPVGAV